MRFQHLIVLAGSISSLTAQSAHSIYGRVHTLDGIGVSGCEVVCQNSRGQIQKCITNSKGDYRFISVPLGSASVRAIQPKAFEFFGSITFRISPPFSDCTRDLVVNLPLIPESVSFVLTPPRFANSLPPGTFHFHPNAEPQWVFE